MKYAPWILALVLGLFLALQWKQNRTLISTHEAAERKGARAADSLAALYHKADLYALQLATELNLFKQEKAQQTPKTAIKRKAHETAANSPIIHFADSAIVREWASLYRQP